MAGGSGSVAKRYNLRSSVEAHGALTQTYELDMDSGTGAASLISDTLLASPTNIAVWSSPVGEPGVLTWPTTGAWTAVIDVSAMGAAVSLFQGAANTSFRRDNSGLTSSVDSGTGTWDSTTGTGLHTYSATDLALNDGSPNINDRFVFRLALQTSSTMMDNTYSISVNTSSTYAEGPWSAGPSLQSVTLDLIDASSAIYAPTLVGKNSVSLGLIDAAGAIYAPTLLATNTLTLGLIDAGSAIYAPALIQHQFVTLGLIDAAGAIYAPTLLATNTLTLGLIDAGSAVYAPTLATLNAILLDLIDAGSAIYAPTISSLGGTQSISLDLIDAGSAIYAPTLVAKNTITPGLIDSGSAIYAPTLVAKNTITPGLIDSGSAIYAPTLAFPVQSVTLGLIDAGSAIYEPTVVARPSDDYGLAIVADGAIAYWPMSETSGTVAHEVIAGRNGSYVGGVTLNQGGPFGALGAASFDGTDDYMTVPHDAALNIGNGPFSIEFWIRRENLSWMPFLFDKGFGGWGVSLEEGGSWETWAILRLPDSAFSLMVPDTSGELTEDAWHHIVFTKTGTTTLGYFNGVLDYNPQADITFGDTSAALQIARGYNGSIGYAGRVAHVALYDYDLSGTQVADHYAIAFGFQEVSLGLIDAGSAIYAPTLVAKNAILLDLIDAGSAIYAPTATQPVGDTQSVTLDLIDATSAIYAPTLLGKNAILLDLIDAGSAIYAPTVATIGPQTLVLGLIDADRQVYAIVVVGSLTVGGDLLNMRGGPGRRRYPWTYSGLRGVR
jgi:hypothetical protein